MNLNTYKLYIIDSGVRTDVLSTSKLHDIQKAYNKTKYSRIAVDGEQLTITQADKLVGYQNTDTWKAGGLLF
jgi:hypothetical protein